MKKYIAIQHEDYNFDWLIDDDGIKSAGGLNCEVFGIGGDYYRKNSFINESEFEDICNDMDNIVTEFDNLTYMINKGFTRSEIADNGNYQSYKEIIEDFLYDKRYKKYSPKMVADLKRFVEREYNSIEDDITEFLTITTGLNWVCEQYNGYSQSDWCYLIYCADKHTEEYMDLIGKAAVGCACEFGISENLIETDNKDIDDIIEETLTDCCWGYFLTDTDVWNEDRAKAKLAEYIGCKANELSLILIDSSYSVIRHNYKIA